MPCGKERVALHEASHAVAMYFTRNGIEKVSIVSPLSDPLVAGYVLPAGVLEYTKKKHRGFTFISPDEHHALRSLFLCDFTQGWKRLRARARVALQRTDWFVLSHTWLIRLVADELLKSAETDGKKIESVIENALRARGPIRGTL